VSDKLVACARTANSVQRRFFTCFIQPRLPYLGIGEQFAVFRVHKSFCDREDGNVFGNEIDKYLTEPIHSEAAYTADYQISRENFDRLKQAAEQKKPIVLFTHIPLYSEELFRIAKNALIAIPDEIVNTFSPFRTFEQRADETTRQCYDFIQGCPYVKAIVSGHLHLPFESSAEGAKKQLVTSLDTLHEITIE
jgi:hypothetical protein